MSYDLGRDVDHIHLRAADLEASGLFYRAVCQALRMEDIFQNASGHLTIDEIFVDAATDSISRIHLAFQAKSRDDVDTFHRLAVEAGGTSNGVLGLRPYHDQYYAAFVLDPDGNNIETICDAPSHRSCDAVVVERG